MTLLMMTKTDTVTVLTLYADNSGCGDYRVRFPAQSVNERSGELGVRVLVADHLNADALFDGKIYKINRVDVPPGVKVVSFQRPMQVAMAGAIAWLRKFRPDIGIVVELDDDLFNVPVSNTAYRHISPKTNPTENTRWLRDALANCDVLTVSTPELARRFNGFGKYRTVVVRNAVPDSMLDQPIRTLDDYDRVIGWAGYAGTHPGDLEVTGGALSEVVGVDKTHGRTVSFRNIGPGDGVAEALGLRPEDVEASGWLKPEMYRLAIGELDIGIVPLADNVFNKSKSFLKAIEYASAGVPVVASKLPEFEDLQKNGMPIWLVKNRRREWVAALKHLLSLDNQELIELGLAHREFVRRNATASLRAEQWADAWLGAVRKTGRAV